MHKLTAVLLKKFTLFVSCLAVSFCAVKEHRFRDIGNIALADVVHHEVLNALNIEQVEPPPKEYEPELRKYLHNFIADAHRHGYQISPKLVARLRVIKYVDKLSKGGGPGVVATCNRYLLRTKTLTGTKITTWNTIEVLREDAAAFIENEEVRLRMLLYHELFHCFMGRGHLPSHMPAGIMSETLIKGNAKLYEEKWEQMVDDMFDHAEYCPEIIAE